MVAVLSSLPARPAQPFVVYPENLGVNVVAPMGRPVKTVIAAFGYLEVCVEMAYAVLLILTFLLAVSSVNHVSYVIFIPTHRNA